MLSLPKVVTVLTPARKTGGLLGGGTACAGSFRLSQRSLPHLRFRLWPVLVGQPKQLSSRLVVQGLGELVHCRRHSQVL